MKTALKETTKIFKYKDTVTIETYKNQVAPKFVWVTYINDAASGVRKTGFSSIIVETI